MSRLTPMQQHQQRVRAAAVGTTEALNEQQRAMQWLHTQRALLASLSSRQSREEHKAQVLPEIEPYLRGVLQADSGEPDPVVSHAAVWALDAGNWPLALELGAHMIKHSLPAPDEFKRSAATLLCDLMADAALTGRMSTEDLKNGWLDDALRITQGADMPEQTRAKTHKAIAYGLAGKTTLAGQPGDWKGLSADQLRTALDHLNHADKLDQNAGVKKDIAAVQKLLAAAEPATTTASAPAKRARKP